MTNKENHLNNKLKLLRRPYWRRIRSHTAIRHGVLPSVRLTRVVNRPVSSQSPSDADSMQSSSVVVCGLGLAASLYQRAPLELTRFHFDVYNREQSAIIRRAPALMHLLLERSRYREDRVDFWRPLDPRHCARLIWSGVLPPASDTAFCLSAVL